MTFGRPSAEENRARRVAEREANMAALAQPASVRLHVGVYSGGTAAAMPKGPTAKPGKGRATAAERVWLDFIVAFGCVACWLEGNRRAPCVHHILRGGRRMGHLFTLPLCPGHHQDGTGEPGMVARHPYKARFEAKYGKELDLLDRLRMIKGGAK